MAAKTGLSNAGARRWFSVRWGGPVAKADKNAKAYLRGAYGTALDVDALDAQQIADKIAEALNNHRATVIANELARGVSATTSATATALMISELDSIAVDSED